MNDRNKVCFLNLNALSAFDSSGSAPFGGTELQISRLARFFARDGGFDVILITGRWGSSRGQRVVDGVRIVESVDMLDRRMSNKAKAPFILWKAFAEIDADVYIGSAAALEMGILAIFCLLRRKRFIYRIANDAECNGIYVRRHPFIGRIFSLVFPISYHIVAQADTQAALLGRRYREKTSVIKSSFDPPKGDESGEKSKRNSLLWVGRCIPRKNPDLFLKLAETFPGEQCVLVVSRVAGFEKYFQEIVAAAEKIQNLTVLIDVPYVRINELFLSARIFVSTAEYEGFPNTFLEACFSSVPLVSLNVNPDLFITKNHLGYCVDGNFQSLINKVAYLIGNQGEWEKKSVNAFEYSMHNHDIEAIGKQWRDLLCDGLR